jgi:hypothetical protein
MRRVVVLVLLALASLGATAPAQAQNRFWLVNNSPVTIQEAYVSSSRVEAWGPDILGASVLPSGQRVWVTPAFGDCVLDVRVVYQNGREERRMGVNACSLTTIAFGAYAPGPASPGAGAVITQGRPVSNPSFVFVNSSGRTIREVYVSLSTENSWGPDRLGANVLQPGQSLSISLPAGNVCTVDMRVVYMDGGAQERRRVETCSIASFGWR